MAESAVPSITTSPPSIESRPERQLSSVVLPQPLGPMIATISPAATARSTPRSAFTRTVPVSYVLCTDCASTIGSASRTPSMAPPFVFAGVSLDVRERRSIRRPPDRGAANYRLGPERHGGSGDRPDRRRLRDHRRRDPGG